MDETGPILAEQSSPLTTNASNTTPSLRDTDTEKQVTPIEPLSGSDNAPILTASDEKQVLTSREVVREADKEVTSSWQSKAKEDGAPIPMDFHESQLSGELMNDIKGAPPAYDSLTSPTRTLTNDTLFSPISLGQGEGASLPPRPEDRSAVGQLLAWIPSTSQIPLNRMLPLIQPVVIPQIDVPPEKESVPFRRCYSDSLASHGVPMREFIAFLDGLAIAQAPNSALQSLKMFGVGASKVPLPFIPLAGHGIRALASSGSGDSSSRAKLYLERAKREYFAPRGLRLSVIQDSDLNARLQMPTHAYRLAPLTKNTLSNSVCERRLEGVAPYVAPLRYDVPEGEQVQGIHKLARKHLQKQLDRDVKKLSKMRQDQWLDITYSGYNQQEWDTKYANKMAELRQLQVTLAQRPSGVDQASVEAREALDALRQDQRDLQILSSERQMEMQNLSARGDAVQAEMKEEKWCRRLKWILIENLQ